MAPKRATRTTPVTTTPAITTTVTNAQLQAMIDQGVSAALATRETTRNGTDSHSSGTGVRGSERVARECTYQDFMKCKPLYFKGTEGVTKTNMARKSISQNQQQPNKRQNTGKAYATGHGEKKYYGGSKPLCAKCNYHHDGSCPPKCHRCNIVGHLVRNCRRPTNDITTNNQRGTGTSQKVNCYECGNQGNYKRDCPERKNQSHKNQIGGTRAHGVVHTLRGGETDQDPNNIKDEIEA
ncbi:reverse transcriptase [Tanacetum coccineum]